MWFYQFIRKNMQKNLFIAPKLKIGYQNRSGTYDGKLSYIIYFDEKGKLRKEASWKTWCEESLGSHEFENVPTKGLMLNKQIVRDAYSFGHYANGRTMARIYDPRGFEFEITIENFFGICSTHDLIKGEIVGEFVYAWDGTELVLLPVNSQQYKEAIIFTENKNVKMKSADLEVGYKYLTKLNKEVTYIGKYTMNGAIKLKYANDAVYINKGDKIKDIFYDGYDFVNIPTANICEKLDENDNIENLINRYLSSKKGLNFKNLKFIDLKEDSKLSKRLLAFEDNDKLILLKLWNTYERKYGTTEYIEIYFEMYLAEKTKGVYKLQKENKTEYIYDILKKMGSRQSNFENGLIEFHVVKKEISECISVIKELGFKNLALEYIDIDGALKEKFI